METPPAPAPAHITEQRQARRSASLAAQLRTQRAAHDEHRAAADGAAPGTPAEGAAAARSRPAARSPEEWLARLREATTTPAGRDAGRGDETPPVAAPSRAMVAAAGRSLDRGAARPVAAPLDRTVQAPPAPPPLAPATRRFLKPLVGIDPDSVRVHRGPAADAIAAERVADAVTLGDDVMLAAGHEESRPATLGLLAHELTHVARRREPRFVPPVVGGRATVGTPDTGAAADTRRPAGEETLALRVEARGAAAARRVSTERLTSRPTPIADDSLSELDAWDDVPPRDGGRPLAGPTPDRPPPARTADGAHTAAPPSGGPAGVRPPSPWGNLPAPWEPLPDSLGGAGPSLPMVHATGSAATATTPGGVSAAAPSGGGAPAAQLAARGRILENAESPPSPGGAAPGAPRPDIDALARQVYDVLKRRLSADRRRGA
jgi:hypothetical protein